MQDEKHHLPKLDNVSILAATILLAYALTHFISLPLREFEIRVAGVYVPLALNFSTIIGVLITGLTATGAAWLFHDHPSTAGAITVQHWLLPSLTALVLWLTVEQLPFGGQWWVAAGLSGGVLMLVLLAEYLVIDDHNPYYLPASIGISAIALALYLILAIALHAAEVRLFFRVPALGFAAGLVLLRVVHLRAHGEWAFGYALLGVLLIGELAAGFHYWPLNSISYGIILLGTLYALIELSENLLNSQSKTLLQVILRPVLVLFVTWGVAAVF